ncbi:helix-turn-helix domain-containing protein [Streptomyces sp. NBC_00257]|uniref:helix-turn-helix domain-containing protein n=1 Tax=unclassified Streptomyces TaxID=2593676 RepID=UPI00225AB212|nr:MULTISPECIES: helix-turn-helix transcriptional regulator [unclassified Streptomyces]MCX4866470.1 helix-turn-helix domain-containing protein [Streptomyces sp. NBC_00906]MCX4897708.1 helix-turn-helix domain-containing protein [Streptomyces sp. NBC_00892]MCX5431006.1 helix-turn-helix domain-containing protein [Streptomyces sp. NBC_00062]
MEKEVRPERPAESDGTAHLFRALGKMIKLLRERAGLSQKELGLATHCGEDLISAMERGVRTPQPEFLELADDALGAGGLLRATIGEVREALAKARTRHPEWYRGYANLEAAASQLYVYSNQSVPGLLQTEAYARAIFAQWRPLLSEETVEKRVADRLDRQKIFEPWPSPTFHFILDESVLMRPIGGRDVHREQLQALLRIGRLRTVQLQLVPLDRTEQPSIDGPFTLITPKGKQQLAYLEIHTYPRLITEPEEVRVLAVRYGIMQSVALTPWESLAAIEKMLGER